MIYSSNGSLIAGLTNYRPDDLADLACLVCKDINVGTLLAPYSKGPGLGEEA